MDQKTRFPIPAFVVETETERILVDAGLHPDAALDASSHYGGVPSMDFFELEQEFSVADQVELGAVSRVVMTHLHFDHAGGLALLPSNIPVAIQRREWEATKDPDAVARNFYLERDYADIDNQLELIDGDHDLLGDGSIVLLFTSGAHPGTSGGADRRETRHWWGRQPLRIRS